MSQTETIREYAFSLGFDLVGFTSAESFERGEEMLRQWVKNGYAGEMKYMERAPERRARPQEILPGARTIISLAVNYYQADTTNDTSPPSPLLGKERGVERRGKIAKYARGRDYHEVMDKKLEELEKFIQAEGQASGNSLRSIPDAEVQTKRYVDTGPLLEREIAERAGLGFIGKNTNLITRKFGSWVFLAEILTTLELDYDKPARGTCGTCTLCIDACPTQAIVEMNEKDHPLTPSLIKEGEANRAEFHVIDSRLCISYLTIELKEGIPEKLRALMGNWIFGCDICQDVCPFNHASKETTTVEFRDKIIGGALTDLKTLLLIREEREFKTKFKHSPMSRPKRAGIVRNAIVATANSKEKQLLQVLREVSTQDSSEMVRSHAQWALEQMSKKI